MFVRYGLEQTLEKEIVNVDPDVMVIERQADGSFVCHAGGHHSGSTDDPSAALGKEGEEQQEG